MLRRFKCVQIFIFQQKKMNNPKTQLRRLLYCTVHIHSTSGTCITVVVVLGRVRTRNASTKRLYRVVNETGNRYKLLIVGCVVCCHLIYSGRQACGRTSRGHTGGRSHRISHPTSSCGALFFIFSREGFSRSFPSSTVKSIFLYLRFNRSPLVRHFYFLLFFIFGEEKSRWCDDTGSRTHVPTSEGFEVNN